MGYPALNEGSQVHQHEQLLTSANLATVSKLAAGLSHEVNTPAGALLCGADVTRRCLAIITRALESEEGARLLGDDPRLAKAMRTMTRTCDDMTQASQRVAAVAANLATFTGLDRATVRRVDLNSCIKQAICLLGPRLEGRVTTDLGHLPRLLCHVSALNQLWLSLLEEAMADTKGEEQIRIQTRSDGESVNVHIAFRGRTGQLGSPAAHAAVRSHGGKLLSTSDRHGECRVTVVLPLSQR